MSSFFLKGRDMKKSGFSHNGLLHFLMNSAWEVAEHYETNLSLTSGKDNAEKRFLGSLNGRKYDLYLTPSGMSWRRRWNNWERRSHPMTRSFPGLWDPKNWCCKDRFGKIWIRIGRLMIFVQKSFPSAAVNHWTCGIQYSSGKTSGFRIVEDAPVSINAMTFIGLSYLLSKRSCHWNGLDNRDWLDGEERLAFYRDIRVFWFGVGFWVCIGFWPIRKSVDNESRSWRLLIRFRVEGLNIMVF